MPLDPLISFALMLLLWSVGIAYILRMAALEKVRSGVAAISDTPNVGNGSEGDILTKPGATPLTRRRRLRHPELALSIDEKSNSLRSTVRRGTRLR
jgi:hypothetical protein